MQESTRRRSNNARRHMQKQTAVLLFPSLWSIWKFGASFFAGSPRGQRRLIVVRGVLAEPSMSGCRSGLTSRVSGINGCWLRWRTIERPAVNTMNLVERQSYIEETLTHTHPNIQCFKRRVQEVECAPWKPCEKRVDSDKTASRYIVIPFLLRQKLFNANKIVRIFVPN